MDWGTRWSQGPRIEEGEKMEEDGKESYIQIDCSLREIFMGQGPIHSLRSLLVCLD